MILDVRAIANLSTRGVNPNIPVVVRQSSGFITGAGARQVPQYADPVTVDAQVQALTQADVKRVENLNIQGEMRTFYIQGPLAALIRAEGKGGDMVTLPDGTTWLVTQILEAWPTWTKALLVRQNDS